MELLADAFLDDLLEPAALEDALDFAAAFALPLLEDAPLPPASLPWFAFPLTGGDKPPLSPILPKFIILAGVTGERVGLYA